MLYLTRIFIDIVDIISSSIIIIKQIKLYNM